MTEARTTSDSGSARQDRSDVAPHRLAALGRDIQAAVLEGDPDLCLALGCRYWASALGLERAWVGLIDAAATRLVGAAAVGVADSAVRECQIELSSAPASRHAMAAGLAVAREEPAEWRCLSAGPVIVAPLVGGDGVLGVLAGEWAGAAREVGGELLSLASVVAEQVTLGVLAARRVAADSESVGAVESRIRQLEGQLSTWQRGQRLAEEASRLLRHSASRLHAIIDHIPHGLLIVRAPDGVVVLANPAASALLGLDHPGAQSHRLLARDGSAYPDGWLPIRGALGGEVDPPEEVIAEAPDGRRRNLLASAAPLFDADGQVAEVVVVFQDVTRLKEVDRLKSEIISLVSHELRTPLHHIKGFTSTLLTPELTLDEATRQDLLESIEQETNRLILMVTDLLDLARIEAGAIDQGEKTWSEPIDLVRGALRRFESLARGRIVEVVVPADLRAVKVDHGRIERVLINLLGNAVKFSPKGGRIVISAEAADAGLILRVIDRGRGVEPEERERIFERFYRGAGAPRGSVGLGLSICKTIVEAHGGRIWVEDTPGGGATLAFSLPWAGAARQDES